MTIPLDAGFELRTVCPEDAPALHQAIDRNRSRLREWLPWLDGSRTLDSTNDFIAARVVEGDERTSLTTAIWSEGRIVGSIGLHRFEPRHRSSSIGYWLDEAFEGKGLMTRACSAIITAGFRDYRLHRIEIRCASGNQRSAAIPIRLGFREEGLLREAEWLYDHWVDLRVFSMLEQEWKP